ncbi:hypothetical protein [Tumebacillus flagellatus]|nr:hypothetical protein [Tumebacillus flagellatus]
MKKAVFSLVVALAVVFSFVGVNLHQEASIVDPNPVPAKSIYDPEV